MFTIEAKQGSTIEVKRFYVDAKIEQKCKTCENILEYDFSKNYLSYPTIGENISLSFYCKSCDEETVLETVLKSVKLEFEKL